VVPPVFKTQTRKFSKFLHHLAANRRIAWTPNLRNVLVDGEGILASEPGKRKGKKAETQKTA
jgi:hypothetical protein